MTSTATSVDRVQILSITQDVFAAMLDAGEELAFERFEPVPVFDEPLAAWVDMHAVTDFGEISVRAVVNTSMAAGRDITTGLLMLPAGEEVTREDLVDAFGEIANVVGGNVKSLLDATAKLSLPQVADNAPELADAQFLQDLAIDWREHVLVVTLWLLPTTDK